MSRSTDDSLARGRDALAAAGIADEVDAADALAPLAGRSLELDLAIVERLARSPSPDRAAVLSTIAQGAEPRGWKAVVKASRRALYRFGQRGVALPVTPRSSEPAAIVRRAAAPPLEGYVSPIDGRGDRLIWLARPQREGGLLALTAVVNEPAGLRDVAIAELSRKKLHRMEHDLATRHGLTMVAADGAYCDALVAEGFTRARERDAHDVGEYPTYRARLTGAEPASLVPPLFERTVAADDATLEDASRRGATLLDEREFVTWVLERETVAPYLAEIAAARESPLLLSRPQQEERVRAVVTRALHELFAGASGAAYRRRLEEMAYYLHATGRRDLALAAAGTARALAAGSRGGEGIPFCEALARRSFGALIEEDAQRARVEAESSVLIRPGTPAAQGGARPPTRR